MLTDASTPNGANVEQIVTGHEEGVTVVWMLLLL